MTDYARSTIAALARRTGRSIEDLTELFEERAAIRWESHGNDRLAEIGALADLRAMAEAWLTKN